MVFTFSFLHVLLCVYVCACVHTHTRVCAFFLSPKKFPIYADWRTPVLGQFYVLLLGLTFSVFTLKSSSSLGLRIYTFTQMFTQNMIGLKTLVGQSLIGVFPDKQYSSFWPRNEGCLLGFPVSLWNIVGVPLIPHTFEWEGTGTSSFWCLYHQVS